MITVLSKIFVSKFNPSSLLVLIIVILFLYSFYSSYKRRRIAESITSEYNYLCGFKANVFFSNYHKLFNINLKLFHKNKLLLIIGYDYFRHRRSYFVFSSNLEFPNMKDKTIHLYKIDEFSLLKEKEILIRGFRNYKNASIKIKDEKTIELIKKLIPDGSDILPSSRTIVSCGKRI